VTPFARDLLLPPNVTSLARIILIVAAAALIVAGHPIAGLVVGVPAGLTDYLDGYLARRLGQETELGALLDVLADILFALVCFTLALALGVWPLYLLLVWGFRDLGVLALRASAAREGFAIRSAVLGKVATNVNSYAFLLMALDGGRLLSGTAAVLVHHAGLAAIHVGLALQWVTALGYLGAYARGYRGAR
jgi:cardiolipin synthase (CMP-forming)